MAAALGPLRRARTGSGDAPSDCHKVPEILTGAETIWLPEANHRTFLEIMFPVKCSGADSTEGTQMNAANRLATTRLIGALQKLATTEEKDSNFAVNLPPRRDSLFLTEPTGMPPLQSSSFRSKLKQD